MKRRNDVGGQATGGSVTLRTLARYLDLSPTTVSRALNGYPEVGKATRDRVAAAAKELGYVPSSMGRNLAYGRTGLVSVIVSYAAGQFADPFFSEFLIGLSERLRRSDLDLIVAGVSDPDEELALYRRMIDTRRVDAFVVARTRTDDARVKMLLDSGYPFVAHGRTGMWKEHDWIDTDGRAAFRSVSDWLVGLGHRRIGMLTVDGGYFFAGERAGGFLESMRAHALPCDADAVRHVALGEQAAFDGALALLAAEPRPTAILCATDTLALGAIRAARSLGLSVPADLTVVGHDDLPFAQLSTPPLTTLRQPLRGAGTMVGEAVARRLTAKPVEPLHTLLEPVLIERGSHGRAPATTRVVV